LFIRNLAEYGIRLNLAELGCFEEAESLDFGRIGGAGGAFWGGVRCMWRFNRYLGGCDMSLFRVYTGLRFLICAVCVLWGQE